MANEKLIRYRKQLNYSQQQLADLANVTRQTISLIESGDYNPSLNLCINISKALGCTLNDLFWEENNEK